jgi:cobalt-zinc-cadmium efflux system membrane fusion protein
MIVAAGALFVLFAALGARLFGIGRSYPVTPPQTRTAPGTFRPSKTEWAGLGVATVRMTSFRPAIRADGHIAIDRDLTTPVFSPYSGRVTQIDAKLGQFVEKGAPLLALDGSELVEGEDKLVAALSKRETAQARLRLATDIEQREHALYLARGAALKDWQKSGTELIAAQNRLRTAQIAVMAAREHLRILGNTPQEIARLESAPAQQGDPIAWVRAPISGTVTERRVGLGEYIKSGGAKPVYTIGDLSKVWLVADVRERDAPLIRLGEPVAVRVLAYPGRVFNARISWVASNIDPQTHRLPVRAEVENPDGALKPMMFARFRIVTGSAIAAPAVPQSAIIHRGHEERVWVKGPGGTLAVRTIRTGMSRHGMVEILSGLEAGEQVVTRGTLFIDHAATGD